MSKVDTSDGNLHKWAVRVRYFAYVVIGACVITGIMSLALQLAEAEAKGSVGSEIAATILLSIFSLGISIAVIAFVWFLLAAILDRQAQVARNLQILAEKATADQEEKKKAE